MAGTDLATGDMKGRIAKIVTERIARKLGAKFGDGGAGDLIRKFVGDFPPGAVDLFGIGGAAFLQSPRGLAQWIANKTTFDVDKVDEALNEGVDSGWQSYLEAASKRKKDGPWTEAEYDASASAAANAALKKLEDAGSLTLDRFQKKVVADGLNRVFHELNCPVCWKSQSSSRGKGKDAKAENKTTYKEGHREVTLRWALENKYAPTQGSCCGVSAVGLVDDALNSPKDFFACVDTLKNSAIAKEKTLYTGFYDLLGAASKQQLAELRELGGDKHWSKAEVIQVLRVAKGDVKIVIKLIGSKVTRPKKSIMEQLFNWGKKNAKAALGITDPDNPEGQAEIDKIRQGVDKFSRNIRQDAVRRTRRADRLEAEFRKR